ncbi:serine/threonine-protein kinase M1 [Gurleya vavrai]
MDLNRILNNIFKRDENCQNRNLYIRTYCVIPLTHKNGIIEWIDGLTSLKTICEKEYKKLNLSIIDTQRNFRNKKKIGVDSFDEVLANYPPVLNNWFLDLNDPYEYYFRKQKFLNSYAVMCVVGWFMGLGDRHLENIMIDSITGDTFHVDLNCIFEKGKKLDVPERVPFRLTQNLIHAFGPLGYNGHFKATMEACLKAMHKNKDLIMSNLMLFLYDPLHEWKSGKKKTDETIKNIIDGLIQKLNYSDEKKCIEDLLIEATDKFNLANMYIGWCSFI